jgi:hypothetical protein
MSKDSDLAAELRQCADELARAVEEFKASCEPGSPGFPSGIDPHRVRDHTGRPILAEMLASQGQVLSALALLPRRYAADVQAAAIHADPDNA